LRNSKQPKQKGKMKINKNWEQGKQRKEQSKQKELTLES